MFSDLIALSDRAPRLRIVIDHLPVELGNHETVFRDLASRPQVCPAFCVAKAIARRSS
jgi:hypothetical protein